MCLSTVYKNVMTQETIAMKNVMSSECRDGYVILTDLMERTCAIEGELEKANLVDGFEIVREKISSSCRCPGSLSCPGGFYFFLGCRFRLAWVKPLPQTSVT